MVTGLLLDSLPDNAHDNITRYISDRANAKDWPRFLDEHDVAALYEVGGGYGLFVCARFDTINVSTKYDGICIDCADLAGKIIRRGGDNFKTIRMRIDDTNKDQVLSSVMEPYPPYPKIAQISN